jgi:Ca2+-binding RTX toxin-like protein
MSSNIPFTEALESRTLLSSAFISQTVLNIVGDLKTANAISVHRTGDNEITVSINGKDTVFGSCDPITKVVIDGGNQADKLVINETDRPLNLPVEMNGRIGDDTLIGGAGDDTLKGGVDDDSIDGNGGNDMLMGQNGEDAVHGGDGDDQVLGGAGNDTVTGGAGNDSIWGNAGHDNVSGDDGNDVMYGGKDEDAMFGGNGNDTFHGGDPHDKMDGGAGKNRFVKK